MTDTATGKQVIASSEVFAKLALYYLHERGWAHIRWGTPSGAPGDQFAPSAADQMLKLTTPRGEGEK